MWTIERLTALCVEYCGRCGVEFNSPVTINPRTTRRLGCCIMRQSFINNKVIWNPTEIEFSKKFLSVGSDKEIEDVVAHECAHYVSVAITHEYHGHDETFRYYCNKIGTTNNGSRMALNSFLQNNTKVFKYSIYCSECGQLVGGKSRACEMTKFPQNFRTSCCHATLKVVQNW